MKLDLDFDTLIYIIVMIVFIVLGAFGKKKKPVPKAPVATGEEEGFTTPEDIIAEKLKAFIGDYSQPEPSSSSIDVSTDAIDTVMLNEGYVEKPILEEIDRFESVESGIPLDQVNEIHDAIHEGAHVFEEFNYDEHSSLADGDLTKQDQHLADESASRFEEIYSDFDIRKAIIFSEIIQSKRF